jgi:2-polyprenyl-6-methoxyphenol hydroxylase-like FAD-dependent oxidoreductase
MTTTLSERAVVLGGSVAGLLAARVLADVCAEVVVVERDRLPAGAEHRRGVPQGRHVHGLLARGGEALEELFPGMTRGLTARGVPVGDMLADTRLYFGGHLFLPGTSGLTVLGASRPMLEAYLRDRVRELAGVRFLEGCDAVGLTSPDGGRVHGVRVIRRRPGSAEEVLAADLVVDATGRGSRTPTWLTDLGHRPPTEDSIQVGVGYASRTYRLTPRDIGGTMAILAAPTPAHPRGGAFAAMEGGRFILTLFGMLGDHPPTDLRGFTGFAASVPFPDLHDALQAAEPLDEPVAYRYPASIRRRYERQSRSPDGLLVMGDAVAAFNPIYGQGISVAALQALALRRHLQREPWPPSTHRLRREIGRVVDVAWDLANGADLTFPDVPGRRTARMRTINRYVAGVQAAAADDPAVGRAFLRVAGLVDPPQALLRPAVAARVARHALTGGTRGEVIPACETAVQQTGCG